MQLCDISILIIKGKMAELMQTPASKLFSALAQGFDTPRH